MFQGLTAAMLKLDGRHFVRDVWPVLEPMLVGSIILGTGAGILVYATLRPLLASLQGRRKRAHADSAEAKGNIVHTFVSASLRNCA